MDVFVSSVFMEPFLEDFFFMVCFFVVFFMEPSSFFISVEVVSVDFASVLAASSAKAAIESERIPAAARAMSFFKVYLLGLPLG